MKGKPNDSEGEFGIIYKLQLSGNCLLTAVLPTGHLFPRRFPCQKMKMEVDEKADTRKVEN